MAKLHRDTRRITIRIWEDTARSLEKMATADVKFNDLCRRALESFVTHAEARARAKIDEQNRVSIDEPINWIAGSRDR